MTTTGPSRIRRFSPADLTALAYAVVCAGLLIWAVVVTALDTTDESMAGVIPILATAPTSLLFLALPDGPGYFIAAVVVGTLVNAAVIRWCGRALSRGAKRSTGK
ncbi:SCO4225 family membrane protein [Streptomyces sp. DSM 118878]